MESLIVLKHPSLAFFPLLACSALAQVSPVIESTFEVDVDGWIATSAIAFQQQPTLGNPGGRLFIDNSETNVCYIIAPAKFGGDLSAYAGGWFSFDGLMVGTGGSPWTAPGLDYGNVRFTGTGGKLVQADLVNGPPPTAAWQTWSVRLDAAAFGATPADFAAVLANVTELRISVEALFGPEQQAIDNVRITPAAACVVRNGTGVNPVDYSCNAPPVLGGNLDTKIATPPGTVATMVLLASGGNTPPLQSPFGDLLVSFTSPTIQWVQLGSHVAPLPNVPALAGIVIASQGFRVLPGPVIQALNAIDLRLGY